MKRTHGFLNRAEAGRLLADLLHGYAKRPETVVLALPRGGVPVAFEVAMALGCPLDVLVVRKLGVPGHEELAMGAIASGGVRVLNSEVVQSLQVPPEDIEAVARSETRELQRREVAYRGGRPPLNVQGRTVILVDDGLATGTTMRAAVSAVRALGASRVVAAVPVGSISACRQVQWEADDLVCPLQPEDFSALSLWYADFRQTIQLMI